MSFGILTLATPGDYLKAIGLALSARVSNPGVPTAVACSQRVRPLVAPYFDHVVDEDSSLRGFMHKLHLDRYSPFEETFFFDSDVLLFRPLNETIAEWRDQAYTACGGYRSGGMSSFGLDIAAAAKTLGVEKLVCIDGAGHAYYRKPDCHEVFERARAVARDYEKYCGSARFCDEDTMAIAMTMLGLRPMPKVEFWSRFLSGVPGTVEMDAPKGECEFELVVAPGQRQRPFMMHFAANEAPFDYTRELRRLFKHFGVSPKGLFRQAAADYVETRVVWRGKRLIKKLIKTGRSSPPRFRPA
jgi:hypothetical protein